MIQLIGMILVVWLVISGLVQAFVASPLIGVAFVATLAVSAVAFARGW